MALADAPEDDELTLAHMLDGLANPTRLALLRQIRSPRAVGEIRLRAEQPREGLNPDRAMTRQAVRNHLDRLLQAGFVQSREGRRGSHVVEEFLINHQRLFALTEELLRLAGLRPAESSWATGTAQISDARNGPSGTGPRLVLVHGLSPGCAFPLQKTPEKQSWIIGRRWGLDASLDYDPYVSSEHARIVQEGTGFWVEDLPTSRNGTSLNWQRIEKNGKAPLLEGDVIGVGKSLLLFRK